MIRELKIVNKKGLKLSLVLSVPDKGICFPAAILLQGFLGKKDGDKLKSLSNHLVSLGMATVRLDYSGYGDSDGSTEGEYRVSNMVDDIECVLGFIKQQKYIDTSRVGIWGQSMGGMLAIIIGAENKEIKAVCSVSSPIQITKGDDLERIVGDWKARGFIERKNTSGEVVKISYDFVTDALKWSSIELVKKIGVPLLVILGKKDETVPAAVTREIYLAANEPKELVEIEDMPHDYKVQNEFMEKINVMSGNFFIKNL